jgi:hypothetical protein
MKVRTVLAAFHPVNHNKLLTNHDHKYRVIHVECQHYAHYATTLVESILRFLGWEGRTASLTGHAASEAYVHS